MNDFKTIQDPSPISNKQALLILAAYFLLYTFIGPFILVLIDRNFFPGLASNPITDVVYHTGNTLLFLFLASKLLTESTGHMNLKSLIVPIIVAPIMLYGTTALSYLMATISGQASPANQELILEAFKANRLPVICQVVVFAPVVEEIVFRGILYRHLKKAGRYLVPLLFSTLMFAGMHILVAVISSNYSDLWYLPVYAFMSLLLTYTYEKTQNLYSSMFLHFLNNAVSILAMML